MISALYQSASNWSQTIQSVQETLVPSAKAAAAYTQDEVLAKIGQKRLIKTSTGTKEIVELGPLGDSRNVTKVRCLTTDKEYALKRMALGKDEKDEKEGKVPAERAQAMVSLEALQMLADKAEFLPTLSAHQNVVKILAAQVDNTSRSHGQVFLMELCDEPVSLILQNQGPMSAEEALKMVKDVAEGLQFLHNQKEGPVIHGSVEVSHVLKGKGGEFKLSSFSATHFDAESPTCHKVKSDIWQLGVLLFVALFGIHPFGGEGENSEAANSLKKGCALAVPHGRPKSLLEGRLCILMHWLLVPDACLRPSAKQVSVLLGHLEKMVASQLIKALPVPVQKTVYNSMKGAERQTLVDGLEHIPTHVGRGLVKEYGEGILLNPKLIPSEKLQQLMPRAIMSRIKELHTLYGLPEGPFAPNGKKKADKKAQEAKEDTVEDSALDEAAKEAEEMDETETQEESSNEETASLEAAPESVDLMNLSDESKNESTETIEASAAPVADLMDLSDEPKEEKAKEAGCDLLDMDEEAAEPQVEAKEEKPKEAACDLLDMDEPKTAPLAEVKEEQPKETACDLLDMGDASPEVKQTQDDLLDMNDGVKEVVQNELEDLLDMGVEKEHLTLAPPAAPTSNLDILNFDMSASVPDSTAQSLTGVENLQFGAPAATVPAMPVNSMAPVMAPMAPAQAPVTMMTGYPVITQAMAPTVAPTVAPTQGNPFAAAPVVQGNPFEQGNPFAAPAEQGNPFGAPVNASAANPFEDNHNDAFAFAVSDLKGKMSLGQ